MLAEIIYDIADAHPPSFPWLILLVTFAVAAATLAWRPARKRTRVEFACTVWLLLVCFLLGLASVVLWSFEQNTHATLLQRARDGKVTLSVGIIEEASLESKVWKTDPIPTFVVDGQRFECDLYSDNSEIPLAMIHRLQARNASVHVYSVDGIITKMTADEK